VRQIVDESGEVLFYQSYEPYGNVLSTEGNDAESSSYGFAGEWTDAYIKLIYLRSRYYAPTTGRFLTRDVWQGDYTRPLSLNRWIYVEGNPIIFSDPTGHWLDTIIDIASIVYDLNKIKEEGWTTENAIALGVDFVFAALPLATAGGAMTRAAMHADDAYDYFRASQYSDNIANIVSRNADDVVELTGQWHHVISNKIQNALDLHPTLRGAFERNKFVLAQALDYDSHKGYQTWHRLYDDEIVEWIRKAGDVTDCDFVNHLVDVYKQNDMTKRFPNAVQQLSDALGRLKP
jgi:RHS repeat-associated protein